jgi:5-formyltetrahydrofolate cyclo-ligase
VVERQFGSNESSPGGTPLANAAKLALRDQLITARNRRGLLEVGESARAIGEHVLAAPEVRRAATVAAYVSVGNEPGTTALLESLVDRVTGLGKRIVLPVVQPDLDLDWSVYHGATSLAPARMGLLEPTGPRLGVDSIGTADLLLVPGLAVSPSGERMGRGGGCYDRALARVPVGTPVWVLLYDDEVGLDVPVEPHDRKVTGAVTPSGLVRFTS